RFLNPRLRGGCRRGCGQRSRLAPVEDELPLCEEPAPVDLGERIQVAERGDHDLALAVLVEDVMGEGVALTRGAVAVDGDRALTVEVRGHLVAVQVVEHWRERLPSLEDVRRLGPFPL